jgi:transcriptional regulator with XRE-family HTH domain
MKNKTERVKYNLPLNERLRLLRKDLNLLQREVAEAVGTTETTYAGYEARESADNHRYPQIHMLKALASFYNTTTDYLIGLTDVKEPRKADTDIMVLLEKKQAKVNGIELAPEFSNYVISTLQDLIKVQKQDPTSSTLHRQAQ